MDLSTLLDAVDLRKLARRALLAPGADTAPGKPTPTPEDPVINPEKLPDVAKWASAGFTLLTAILTFFSVKEGVLDRLLRADPTAALWVFILVGLGVVCGVLAPAFAATTRLRTTPIVLLVLVIAAFTWRLLDDLQEEGQILLTRSMTVLVAVALLLSAWLLWGTSIALMAAVLLVGIAALSMGLYGAAKLSVLTKAYPTEPRVVAQVTRADTGDSIAVTVKASRQDDASLLLILVGDAGTEGDADQERIEAGTEISRAVVPADAGGQVDASYSFPLDLADWRSVSVRVCGAPPSDDPARAGTLCPGGGEVARIAGDIPGEATVSGSFAAGAATPGQASRAAATLTGRAVAPGDRVVASVHRRPAGGADVLVSEAVLSPGQTGDLTWTTGEISAAPGEVLVLTWCPCVEDDVAICLGRTGRTVATFAG